MLCITHDPGVVGEHRRHDDRDRERVVGLYGVSSGTDERYRAADRVDPRRPIRVASAVSTRCSGALRFLPRPWLADVSTHRWVDIGSSGNGTRTKDRGGSSMDVAL